MSTLVQVGTWTTRANIPVMLNTSSRDISNSLLFILKACLLDQITTGTLSGPARHANSIWSVVGSGDGTAASLNDGVDRWTSTFDSTLIRRNNNGLTHSFILLRNTALAVDMCLGCNSYIDTNFRCSFSAQGSWTAGGTALLEPTSLESWGSATSDVNTSSQAYFGDLTPMVVHYAHFSCDTEGRWHFFVSKGGSGIFNTSFGLQKSVGATAGDVYNRFFWGGVGYGISKGAPTAANVTGTTGCLARTPANGPASGGAGGVYSSGQLLNANATLGTDAYTSQAYFAPVLVWSLVPFARRGSLLDVYEAIGATPGASYPSVVAQMWVVSGHYLIPFVGTAPIL